MKTFQVFVVCLTWLLINVTHDWVKVLELQTQAELAEALKSYTKRPSVQIVPESHEGSKL